MWGVEAVEGEVVGRGRWRRGEKEEEEEKEAAAIGKEKRRAG